MEHSKDYKEGDLAFLRFIRIIGFLKPSYFWKTWEWVDNLYEAKKKASKYFTEEQIDYAVYLIRHKYLWSEEKILEEVKLKFKIHD